MNIILNKYSIVQKIILLSVFLQIVACRDFVDIDPPRTDLINEAVFESDETALSAISDIYFQMKSGRFSSGDFLSFTYYSALSSDELINFNTSGFTEDLEQFNKNSLIATNSLNEGLWAELYQYIYKVNAIIEGLEASSNISQSIKKQLTGEALFIRAFSHFYLVNLFGDVPIAAITDYKINASSPRMPVADVYSQIIKDLIDSKELLADDYSYFKGERVRPNKGVVSALLARVYLYLEDWSNAELEATSVISDPQYSLEVNLTKVFSKNSTEAIWQIWSDTYPRDIFTFYIFGFPSNGALRNEFVEVFEEGDSRLSSWIGLAGGQYYHPKKYQSFTPAVEYSTIFRLAEQYLIRAEARAYQNKLAEAAADIDEIRVRAGLSNTTATTQSEILDAVMQERRVELFTEWGHRWFDLKRTGRASSVLSLIKPDWLDSDILFPIPESQILNSNFSQNPGYN